ncbi:ABC transporter substrate-binding protein [Roseomonas sp. OT10]|uniref:CmpA/NrtA family ABC transporter substrate-binding protein n=1 Tax=Roseomonas cutis TaxID=2897332 RepID=UPI001E29D34A|nr:CmpA/NrtA family ABC transporter substrate-binding protein [Roseomonas sp. OT10]UFN48220.1 ABC transporter substrate-binding protein [Roseomonas sp. OT10]
MPDDLAPPRPVLLRERGTGLLRIGYVPLTDAAPLVVAEELGILAAAGLRVALSAETSWAALRDKIAFGGLDAAQVLGPLPIALACGLGGVRRRLSIGAGMGLNGNRLVLSNALTAALAPAGAPVTPAAFAALARAQAEPLRLAVVFPFSSHNYLLRHWLALGGLDPDRDLRLVVVPPSRAVEALEAGAVDGFCAGEPWGSHAAIRGAGRVVLSSGDIWPGHPEKMLAFAEGWAERDPDRAVALTAAVIAAARWLDEPANRAEAVAILHERVLPGVPRETIALAFAGLLPDGTPLAEGARLRFRPATLPRAAAAAWWLGQMRRWRHMPEPVPAEALAPYDDRLWRAAAARLAEAEPTETFLTEPRA